MCVYIYIYLYISKYKYKCKYKCKCKYKYISPGNCYRPQLRTQIQKVQVLKDFRNRYFLLSKPDIGQYAWVVLHVTKQMEKLKLTNT